MLNLDNMNLENIHGELMRVAEKQRLEEIAFSSMDDEKINKSYVFLESKLDYVPEVQSLSPELQKKFASTLMTINSSDRKDAAKLSLIGTYATIINKVNADFTLLTETESILLALSMSQISLKSYDIYGDVFASKKVLQSIEANTTSTSEQIDIIDDMLDMLDEVAYPDMDQEDYENTITGCVNIANNYITKEKHKN